MKGHGFVTVTADPERDVGYIGISAEKVKRSIRAEDVVIDLDEQGRLVGIELLALRLLPEAWK